MQRLDNMFQTMIPNMEQAQPVGSREDTLSPIVEETQEPIANSGGAIEIEESAEEEQTPQASSSYFTTPPNLTGVLASLYGPQIQQSQLQSKAIGPAPFMTAQTPMVAKMRAQPLEPLEQSRTVTPPLIAHGTR